MNKGQARSSFGNRSQTPEQPYSEIFRSAL